MNTDGMPVASTCIPARSAAQAQSKRRESARFASIGRMSLLEESVVYFLHSRVGYFLNFAKITVADWPDTVFFVGPHYGIGLG